MTAAADRGDLAESLVPVAAELAWLVRDEGREAIGEWLDAHGVLVGARITEATRAFLVVLAAMVNGTADPGETLEWVTWDHEGRPLEQTIPLLPCVPVAVSPDASLSLPVPAQPAAGAAIRQARNRAGMSQRALAAEAGVGHRTIRGWENGERAVGHGHWVMLQMVLGPLGVVREPGPEPGQERSEGEAA